MPEQRAKLIGKAKLLGLCGLLIAPTLVLAAADAKRFTQLSVEELTPEQHQVADEVLKVSSLGIQGPYNVMLRSPAMAQRLVDLLDYLRFKTSVPRRLNEFAILIQARLWTSQVEWKAHYPQCDQGRPFRRGCRGSATGTPSSRHAAGRGGCVRSVHRTLDQARAVRRHFQSR
jgi:hypothetical protein